MADELDARHMVASAAGNIAAVAAQISRARIEGGNVGGAGEMHVFWVSWYDKLYGKWELHQPWWVSGERVDDGAKTTTSRARAILSGAS